MVLRIIIRVTNLPDNSILSIPLFQAVAGLTSATYDVVLYSKPKGIPNIIGRYAFHVGPMMGMATAFTTATYAATKFRGKDDSFNYVLGGIAAGGVVGAWSKSFVTGCLAGLIMGECEWECYRRTAVDIDFRLPYSWGGLHSEDGNVRGLGIRQTELATGLSNAEHAKEQPHCVR